MEIIIDIHNVKNIRDAHFVLPFDNGVYAFVGSNGCGKSTLMLCLAQLVSTSSLERLMSGDVEDGSFVKFQIKNEYVKWEYKGDGKWVRNGNLSKLNGLYEGSLFYGTRFEDSTNIENKIREGKITDAKLANADTYLREKLSYILHGDMNHYTSLKRIKNKNVAKEVGVKNRPYFIRVGEYLISQYRMSSGECLLISLLHFLYNSIERRSLPDNKSVLVLIDELELALHPVAVVRLMEYLHTLEKEHSNLIVYLSSHSPEVIRTMSPMDLYKVNNKDGILSVESNCYPSYLIRDLYSNVSPDFLLLVEDRLAQLVVDTILSKYELRASKLIYCIPVGGWNNVLELHKELYQKKVLGIHTKIVSILDGDVSQNLSKEQKRFPHLFLPIPSVEKLLYRTIKLDEEPQLRRIIQDNYFITNSLDSIVSQYNKSILSGENDNDKNFHESLF